MINRSNSSEYRRILTFPVVHPCQNILPTTLLFSLISLAQKICDYQPKSFVTQRKNGKEMTRYVRNLLIFLEEISDNNSILPDSINLCFFELHLTFQKILFLLEDCTREGSHTWILMKFKRVSTEFRTLIRTIATALDVLPLGSIQLPNEVKDILDLVSKQAQKAKFDVEPDDEKMATLIISILNQFENKIVPDLIDLNRVFDYLGIRNWNQCNKEIKFLEEEINTATSNGEDREVDFLRNLMVFLIYSRVVVFDFIDEIRSSTNLSKLDDGCKYREMISCLNSEDFLCPISLEIMKDPVIISTGHTFDRVSIHKWFKSGNLICPNTGEKLKNTELVPNSALRKLIYEFISSENGIEMVGEPYKNQNRNDIKRTKTEPTSLSLAAEEAMKMVSEFLTLNLSTGTTFDKNKSAYEIRLLAKSNIFNISCLVKSGTIPYLLNLLSSLSPSTQENAMAALLNLTKYYKGLKIKTCIVENGGLILILDVLIEGLKMETRKLAAETLFHLSSIEEYRKLIGEIPEAIPALLDLLEQKTLDNNSVKRSAVIAILGLLWFPGNHKKVLEAGTVKLLVDLLNSNSSSSSLDFITESLAVLAILAEKPEGTFEILRNSSAIYKLVGILESSSISAPAKEYCVSILLYLCINGGKEVVADLRKPTSLMNSLYSLLTEGTPRANKKASSILKILHEFSDPSSSSNRSLRPEFRQDHRFVHVQ